MKRIILLLSLILSGVTCNSYAQNGAQVPTSGNIPLYGNEGNPGPKSLSLDVSASIYQGSITVFIDWYAGYADIYVEDEDGNEVADDTIYVSGHASTQLNVSALPSGTYTLYVKLRDGSIFCGSFQI